jgi:hypothetical protein
MTGRYVRLYRSAIVTFAATLAFTPTGNASGSQNRVSTPIPSYIYGRWQIDRFVEVGGHTAETKNRAESQVGKTLNVDRMRFRHDDGLLWFGRTPCRNVRYGVEVHKDTQYVVGDKGSLSFYGLETPENDQETFFVVNCDKRDLCLLELAKNRELAVYYDGWFFFLKKSDTASNQPGRKFSNAS